jgi:hypothetical protein
MFIYAYKENSCALGLAIIKPSFSNQMSGKHPPKFFQEFKALGVIESLKSPKFRPTKDCGGQAEKKHENKAK